MRYVIVGNSTAGIAAIEGIREYDKKGNVTVISDEPYFNYSRPLISYLLGKKISFEKMPYREKEFYSTNGIELILNKKATKLDIKKKEVILADGKRTNFDKLLIAAGGIPIIPKIKGCHLGGVFAFTKLSDAEKIAKYIKANKVKKAIIIGGGLIGLKATEAFVELKIRVTIVELADRILSTTFDKKASSIIEDTLGKTGCKVIKNNTVVEIKGKKGKVKEVIPTSQRKIPTDLVIIAIGVKPNTELVKDTPIKTNRGILVDDFMQTNVKNIYAAGDCCEAKNFLLGENRPIAIWPIAVRQGKIAGHNMAGVKEEYKGGFAMNPVELCGIPAISVGETYPSGEGYEVLEHYNKEKLLYKKIVLRNNKIAGVIFIGHIERAGIYTGLIKDKVDVSNFKEYLIKEDFGLINMPKEHRKHLVTGEIAII